jgi:hypothetical protein
MGSDEWDTAKLGALVRALGDTEYGVARKRRLYLTAFCRHFWDQMPNAASRRAVDVAELFVDGRATEARLVKAHRSVNESLPELRKKRGRQFWLGCWASHASRPPICQLFSGWDALSRTLGAIFIRDIFGNPFRPVTCSPSWRTDTAVALARQMYDSRDFSAMPILADALQDAGCDNNDILTHCRGAGPHVRGCWVVDLVLGKE